MPRYKAKLKPTELMPLPASAERFTWLRHEGETPSAYHRFCVFRELPTHARTLELAASRLDPPVTKQALGPTAMANNWYARAADYDAALRTVQARKNPEVLVEAMLSDHAEMLHELRVQVRKAIQNVDWSSARPSDIPPLLNALLNQERQAAALTSNPSLLAKLAEKQQVGQQTTVNVQQGPIIIMPDNGRGDSGLPTMRVDTVEGSARQLPSPVGQDEDEGAQEEESEDEG